MNARGRGSISRPEGVHIRIAHVTDLHLRSQVPGTSVLGLRRSRAAPDLLSEALDDARRRGADVVVVTGDVVDVPPYLLGGAPPDALEPDRWLDDVRADYELTRQRLEDSGLPYVCVPGNHDHDALLAQSLGSGSGWQDIGGLRFAGFWDREQEAHIPRRVGEEERLFAQLLGDEGPPQVHLQHFVITPWLNEDWPHTYDGGETMRQRIVQSGRVRLSLSGHYHRGTALISDDGCAFASGAALAEFPHTYRLYDVAPEPDSREPVTMRVVPLRRARLSRPALFVESRACFPTLPTSWAELGSLRLREDLDLAALHPDGFDLILLFDEQWADLARAVPALLETVYDLGFTRLADEGVVPAAAYVGPSLLAAAQQLGTDLAASRLVTRRRDGAIAAEPVTAP